MVDSLSKFRVWLLGIEFTVVTDCNVLTMAQTKCDIIPRIARWWLRLTDYNFKVEYRPGERMKHADTLSRNPVESEGTYVIRIDVTDQVLASQLDDPNLSPDKLINLLKLYFLL